MILAHRLALDPTVKQRLACARAAGVARFTWNWALDAWNRAYAAGEKPNAMILKKRWNAIKRKKYPWVLESPKDANQKPFSDLQKAFTAFFRKKAKHPAFKKKGQHDAFYVTNDHFRIEGNRAYLPKIGWVRTREALRFSGKVVGAIISRTANRWYLSVQVDVGEVRRARTGNGKVGLDLGLKATVTTSDGQVYQSPRPLKAALKRLRWLSKAHSRKQKGSGNRRKSTRKLARLHARIGDVRRDWLHKLTTRLCRENQAVAIEDLNVRGMARNKCLARAIADVGWFELRRQLTYKAPIYGVRLVVVSRWYPSSKTCSACGHVKATLSLSERRYRCENCGYEADRDLNAARNLAAGLAVSACGEGTAVSTLVEAGTKPRAHSGVLAT